LEDIEKRSQELLGKGKAARILDKARDSGIIVKLVEELRQAILIYQVGIVEKQSTKIGSVDVSEIVIATTVH
jgi:hypothetical protein